MEDFERQQYDDDEFTQVQRVPCPNPECGSDDAEDDQRRIYCHDCGKEFQTIG